jgi:RND family efflux transporter MFP subunit
MSWQIKTVISLIILIAAVLVVVGLAVSRPTPEPQAVSDPVVPKVKAIRANPGPQQVTVHTQGTVRPKREINLASQVSGQVQFVSDVFVDGGFFKQGELLLTLDPRDYEIEIIRSRSRIAEAEQLLATERGRAFQAKREWRDLGNKAGNALFLREPQLKAAEAAVAAAKADLEQAKLNLERTQIKAPFDGRVRQVKVNLGQYLSPGQEVAQIFAIDTVEIRLPITPSQTELLDLPLTPNQMTHLPVTLSTGMGQHQWLGAISRTDASVDPRSRVVYGIVEVDKPFESNPPLEVGLFVRAAISGKQFDRVQLVPRVALYEKDNVLMVAEDQRLVIRPVTVLQYRGETAFISGVEAGDILLIDRPGYVVPGMKVDPVLVDAKVQASDSAQLKTSASGSAVVQ